MTARPYTARRARRCLLGKWCPQGGRIAIGATAYRPRQHQYIHADDLEQVAPIVLKLWDTVNAACVAVAESLVAMSRDLAAWAAEHLPEER